MYWIRRLRNVAGLRERFNQIMRAREHYDADQFDSCTLHLLAIMDGFVNDVEPQTRKALSSRNADEMVAWDHVVGHHLGLTNALRVLHEDHQETASTNRCSSCTATELFTAY